MYVSLFEEEPSKPARRCPVPEVMFLLDVAACEHHHTVQDGYGGGPKSGRARIQQDCESCCETCHSCQRSKKNTDIESPKVVVAGSAAHDVLCTFGELNVAKHLI